MPIGRKNCLFAGHDDAVRTDATLYTLIASAQRHELDPKTYRRSVLAKIATTPMSQIDQFLPEKWEAEDETGLLAAEVISPSQA